MLDMCFTDCHIVIMLCTGLRSSGIRRRVLASWIHTYQTTQRRIPDNNNVGIYRRFNLIFCIKLAYYRPNLFASKEIIIQRRMAGADGHKWKRSLPV